MFRTMFAPAALLLAAPAASAAPTPPTLPAWMEGCWVEPGEGNWTEECWMAPRFGMMMGASRSGSGDRMNSWEFLRIEANAASGMVYLASPGGRGWVPFTWKPSEDGSVTFVNAKNDYPQRIRYWREGDFLKAEIALQDGSRARTWTYKRGRMP